MRSTLKTGGVLLALAVTPGGARAALPSAAAEAAIAALPPVSEVRVAPRSYAVTALARTNHAGWTSASGYVNVPQTARLAWHVDRGGEAELKARDAWDPHAEWRELDRWGRGTEKKEHGETEIALDRPTLLWLHVRGAKFPRSGIASLQLDYTRHTVALLRGASSSTKRPVILAEGYDPFNEYDLNDPAWQEHPALAQLIAAGRTRYHLDPWVLDWGDAAAPLEHQAEDFAEIARQVREWNGGRAGTVAAGISMGAVSVRYALAAHGGDDLGVRKYVSINGPHQGAWINPGLLKFLLKRAGAEGSDGQHENPEAFAIRRGLDNPAAQELLIDGKRHDAFYADLRSKGTGGYAPGIPRVAFSSGALVTEGTDLAELTRGHSDTVHRISVKPLWLPFWLTLHRTRREFRYDSYPGELLSPQLVQPFREHVKLFGLFRFDFRAAWQAIPTFIPTHSALDFPEELEGGPARFHYTRWRDTAFNRIYVARNRNLPHNETSVDWIDPRTGKGAPEGRNAVLWEIEQAFEADRGQRRAMTGSSDGHGPAK